MSLLAVGWMSGFLVAMPGDRGTALTDRLAAIWTSEAAKASNSFFILSIFSAGGNE